MSYWKSGTWNATCAVCGFEFKSDQLQQDWRGLYVCSKDFEPRHILDFFENPPPESTIPWSQPDNDDMDQATAYTLSGGSALILGASATEVLIDVTTTGAAATVLLPTANNTTNYPARSSVTIVLFNNEDSTHAFTVTTASGTVLGDSSVVVGAVSRWRGVPSDNQWIREQ